MLLVLGAVATSALFAAAAIYVHYVLERRTIRSFVNAVTDGIPRQDRMQVILRLASHIHFHLPRRADPYYLARIFAPLGGTPGQLLELGGCCSGLARVLILSLDSLGIPAAQITLSHRSLRYRHCLVEAQLESGEPTLVDPMYGLCYRDQRGGHIGLEDLRAGIEPHFVPIPGRRRAAYPVTELYDWDYARTGTANWVKSFPRRIAYRGLCFISRGEIDVWRQPIVMEWPQLVLCAFFSILSLSALVMLLAMGIATKGQ